MGLFDKLSKVAKTIDTMAGGVGLSELADEAKKTLDEALGNSDEPVRSAPAPAPTPAKPEHVTPAIVKNSAFEPIPAYQLAEGCSWTNEDDVEYTLTYEIPEDWGEFDSHAEPSMCYLYKFEESDLEDLDLCKPCICIDPTLSKFVEEFEKTGTMRNAYMCEPTSINKMYCRAKIDHADQVIYFYAFHELDKDYFHNAIALWYEKDLLGTPLEQKLMQILDHAAETYKETKAQEQ